MQNIRQLFANNQAWANARLKENPEYFSRLVHQQAPEYLWIGCSDSRVPANQIIGLAPGEVFVHRNIANLVMHSDMNALSVIQYAVDVLRVKHILVVGHYGCNGVHAAWHNLGIGLTDNWLRPIQNLRDQYTALFHALEHPEQKLRRLCEINVMQQVVNISQTTILCEAWARKQNVTVHGWCYDLVDGIIRDLHISAQSREESIACFTDAMKKLAHQD